MLYVNSKGADQPGQTHSLISALFALGNYDIFVAVPATNKASMLCLVFVAEQTGKFEPRLVANLENWSRGYTIFFMLNSNEHDIATAHKNKMQKKYILFLQALYLSC